MVIPETFSKHVFLNTLEEFPGRPAKEAQRVKRELNFTEKLTNLNENEEFYDKLNYAIAVLGQIANNEEKKEQMAIKNYKKDIEEKINNPKTPKDTKKYLEKQLEGLQDADINKNQSAVSNVLKQISTLHQDINQLERRLREMTDKEDPKYNKFYEIPEYAIQKIIEEYFRTLSNNTEHKEDTRKFYNAIRKKIDEQIQSFPEEVKKELASIILTDFIFWAANNKGLYLTDLKKNLNDLDKVLNEYFDTQKNTTYFQQLEKDGTIVKNICRDMNKIMGFEYIDEKEAAEYKDFIDQHANDEKKSELTFKGKTYRQITNILDRYKEEIDPMEGKNLIFYSATGTSHGNFYEIIREILTSSANVLANIGADNITPIGRCVFNITDTDKQINNQLYDLSQELATHYSQAFKEQKTITLQNFDKMIERERQISRNAVDKINMVQENLSKIANSTSEFFISHESLKLYSSAEKEDTKHKDFHGRKMNILSALVKLYAANGLGDALLDQTTFFSYLINISSEALGNKNKEPLETYLSMFAGLLMFDDMSSFVSEATKEVINTVNNTPSATINQLHVYNINGVYFPVSFILKNLINQISETIGSGILSLDSNRTAVAYLYPPKSISHLPIDQPDKWMETANEVLNNTSIQIHFLSGFVDYITSIFNFQE